MLIAIYKNDTERTPYLVHEIENNSVILGLELYPEIEQDFSEKLEDIEILLEDSQEYKEAKKLIEQLIN